MRHLFLTVSLLAAVDTRAYTEGDVTAAQLLAAKNRGTLITETYNAFRSDEGSAKNISMYQLANATTWTADMDIDCDGATTANCNAQRDPWYQNQTSCCGGSLAAENVPFFVIPIGAPSNSSSRGISWGQVAAIVYNNQVVYAMFADECGDATVIGEASYAAANLLGINPDPETGGTDDPVTYIVFTGAAGRLASADRANHQKAIDLGVLRARELIQNTMAFNPDSRQHSTDFFEMNARFVTVKTGGRHLIAVVTADGRTVTRWAGGGVSTYSMPQLTPGLYGVSVNTTAGQSVRKIAVY